MSTDKVMDAIDKQNKEYDAVNGLAHQWRRIQLTPVVDDDFCQVKYEYDQSVRTFVDALKINRPQLMGLPVPTPVGFLYCESTEGGMEEYWAEARHNMLQIRGWMTPDCRQDDNALLEWMKTAKVGQFYRHRLGIMFCVIKC